MNKNEWLHLTLDEIKAVQKLLGHVLYHKSPDLFSLAQKLEYYSDPDAINYDSVEFWKNDKSGVPKKLYKHTNFSIAVK